MVTMCGKRVVCFARSTITDQSTSLKITGKVLHTSVAAFWLVTYDFTTVGTQEVVAENSSGGACIGVACVVVCFRVAERFVNDGRIGVGTIGWFANGETRRVANSFESVHTMAR